MEAADRIPASLPDRCVFLGGQPRSGTSLLTSMMRTSDDLFQAFELHIRKPSFVVGNDRRYTRKIFEQLGVPGDDYDRIAASYSRHEDAMNLGAWTGPREEVSAETLSGHETQEFARELLARGALTSALMRRAAEIAGVDRWGFKILGDIIYADKYAAVWPNATFILLVRDPRDHALSVMKLNEQRIARGQQPFYPDYAAVARGWRETIEVGQRVLEENDLNHVVVRYEDLVTDPNRTLAKLSDALDIDLSDASAFNRQGFIEAHTQRFKHHDNLKNPVNDASVGKWRGKMSPAESGVFAEVADDVMRKHGYDT